MMKTAMKFLGAIVFLGAAYAVPVQGTAGSCSGWEIGYACAMNGGDTIVLTGETEPYDCYTIERFECVWSSGPIVLYSDWCAWPPPGSCA